MKEPSIWWGSTSSAPRRVAYSNGLCSRQQLAHLQAPSLENMLALQATWGSLLAFNQCPHRRVGTHLRPAAGFAGGIGCRQSRPIPTRTAPRIVALKTPAEAQALLRKEINAALTAISTTPAI